MAEVKKDELYGRVLALLEKWGDPADVADVYHSLQADYKANAATRAQIKTRLDKIAANEPGYSTWKVGNQRFYGKHPKQATL